MTTPAMAIKSLLISLCLHYNVSLSQLCNPLLRLEKFDKIITTANTRPALLYNSLYIALSTAYLQIHGAECTLNVDFSLCELIINGNKK